MNASATAARAPPLSLFLCGDVMTGRGIDQLLPQPGRPNLYEGYITDLARAWSNSLNDAQRNEVEIFACGPHPMLAATAKLAREFDLPCQGTGGRVPA